MSSTHHLSSKDGKYTTMSRESHGGDGERMESLLSLLCAGRGRVGKVGEWVAGRQWGMEVGKWEKDSSINGRCCFCLSFPVPGIGNVREDRFGGAFLPSFRFQPASPCLSGTGSTIPTLTHSRYLNVCRQK